MVAQHLDSEHFRFTPRTCPSVRWQAELGPKEKSAMSEQAIEERWGWASDIVWVVVYSILVLLVMLLWVYVPA